MYIRPHHARRIFFIWIYVLCTTSNYAIIKAKFAPHLELYVMPLFLERTVAAKRTRIRSAPQNAVLSRAAQGSQTQGVSKPHPRKGTETNCALVNDLFHEKVSKPHPRKGTETVLISSRGNNRNENFKTTSPQGDGNSTSRRYETLRDESISKPHPRKGTETVRKLGHHQFPQRPILKPHPRKGTETRSEFP